MSLPLPSCVLREPYKIRRLKNEIVPSVDPSGKGKSTKNKKSVAKSVAKDDAPAAAAPAAPKPPAKAMIVVKPWVQRTLDTGVANLVEEFRGLAKWTPEGMATEAFAANKEKNRYQDVPCQDKGRIVLKFPGLASGRSIRGFTVVFIYRNTKLPFQLSCKFRIS
ncbi:Protein CBG12693 [Caenorhabditis briggsae]|uniref:Protein CBG12693 n=1 Tax=Caenorhabditis briggsae TaxID=6238 RepID=A8XGD1_CAEBR|nr:Protein CBG12693 [Caenorhabditis briggsae]CAP31637.2 Protein CBG12693 [Caenorhabditis briggsae]